MTAYPRKQGMRHEGHAVPSQTSMPQPVCKVFRHYSGAREAFEAHDLDICLSEI